MKIVHLIGVGGSGMSALARYFLAHDWQVSGSDQKHSATIETLCQLGLKFSEGHSAQNLPEDCELVVYSEAIPADNPERQKAQELKIRQINYFQGVGEVLQKHELVAIAGTHGKTTTTALTALAWVENKLDPTVFVGSPITQFPDKNFRNGGSQWAIVEACEYRHNFLGLQPTHLVIVTLDYDHPDTYPDQESYVDSFLRLAQKIPAHGTLVLPKNNPYVNKIAKKVNCQVVYFETNDLPENVQLQIPGKHNRHNAAAVWKLAETLKLNKNKTALGLEKYTGAGRRFEKLGEINGALFVSDYAHHPVEIAALLSSAREQFPHKKIIAIFQPHQFSRTFTFQKEFAQALALADEIYIADIFEARDTAEDKAKISAQKLAELIPQAQATGSLVETANFLKTKLNSETVIFLIGAGDIPQIYEILK